MKRTLAIILSILMIGAALTACGTQVVSSGKTEVVSKSDSDKTTKEGETVNYNAKSTEALISVNDVPAANLDAADAEYQHKEPVKGEEVATLHTNYGDISMKFFPEVAPKAVASFKGEGDPLADLARLNLSSELAAAVVAGRLGLSQTISKE